MCWEIQGKNTEISLVRYPKFTYTCGFTHCNKLSIEARENISVCTG